MLNTKKLILALLLIIAISPAHSQSFNAHLYGTGTLSTYMGKSTTRIKQQIEIVINSTNANSTIEFDDSGSPFPGQAYAEDGNLYVKYVIGAQTVTGRLLIVGKPGAETGLTGTLQVINPNGFIANIDYSVRLKRPKNLS